MKLRNKNTGEICELGSIRQAWREEKDGGMGYMLLKSNDNNGIIYNSLAELNEEWEDYKPVEPLIKDEKVRKAVRAWAEANGETEVTVNCPCLVTRFTGVHKQLDLELIYSWKVDGVYTITELCGEEEE